MPCVRRVNVPTKLLENDDSLLYDIKLMSGRCFMCLNPGGITSLSLSGQTKCYKFEGNCGYLLRFKATAPILMKFGMKII